MLRNHYEGATRFGGPGPFKIGDIVSLRPLVLATLAPWHFLAFLAFPKTVEYALIPMYSFKLQPVLAYRLLCNH
jgi:hypothetical protein